MEGRKGPKRAPSNRERRAELASLDLEPDLVARTYALFNHLRGLERQVIDVLAVAKHRGQAAEYVDRLYAGIERYRIKPGSRYGAELLMNELYAELGMKRRGGNA